MRVKIVFGNHAGAVHVQDLLGTLHALFGRIGLDVGYAAGPEPGALNVLLENFGDAFTREIESLRGRARFLVIATEFVTGSTFDRFANAPEPGPLARLRARLERSRARRRRRRGEDAGRRDSTRNHYSNVRAFQRRFDNFLRVSRLSDAIWCLSEQQLPTYRDATGSDRVLQLRFGFVPGQHPLVHRADADKDVDFLFTGTRTPYRDALLDALAARKHRVEVIGPHTPAYIREDFVARARICLGLKQFADWAYPSTVRFHYHLMNQSLLVSERTRYGCELSEFIAVRDSEGFVDQCEEMLALGDFNSRGRALYERYRGATDMQRHVEELLARSGLAP